MNGLINGPDLVDRLRKNILNIKFTKVNGDVRIMKCTLKPEYFTGSPQTNNPGFDPVSGRITVWDIEKNDFRSFYISSIITVDNDSGFYSVDI